MENVRERDKIHSTKLAMSKPYATIDLKHDVSTNDEPSFDQTDT